MKTEICALATVDLDSLLEEMRESFTDKEKIDFITDIIHGFDDEDSFEKLIKRINRCKKTQWT